MTEPVKQIPNNGPNFVDLLGQFDKMLGGQTNTSRTTLDPTAQAQQEALLQKIFSDINPSSIDAMVGNILERARQAFGPNTIASNAAGVRGYSDTVLQQLKDEAMARAVGEAAGAKLTALNETNRTAASLVNSRTNASKTTTTKNNMSTLGKASTLLTGGSYGMEIYKKLKKYGENAPKLPGGEEAGAGDVIDEYNVTGTEGGGITANEAGSGGTGTISGGSTTVVPPASTFSADEAALFPSAEEMSVLNEQAAQGAVGAGELSNVPALGAGSVVISDPRAIEEIINSQGLEVGSAMPPAVTPPAEIDAAASLPTEAEMTDLSAQATQGLGGAGELSELAPTATEGAGTEIGAEAATEAGAVGAEEGGVAAGSLGAAATFIGLAIGDLLNTHEPQDIARTVYGGAPPMAAAINEQMGVPEIFTDPAAALGLPTFDDIFGGGSSFNIGQAFLAAIQQSVQQAQAAAATPTTAANDEEENNFNPADAAPVRAGFNRP